MLAWLKSLSVNAGRSRSLPGWTMGTILVVWLVSCFRANQFLPFDWSHILMAAVPVGLAITGGSEE